jgi:hypothetical protein
MHEFKRVEDLRDRAAEEKRLAIELSLRFRHQCLKNQATRLASDVGEFEVMFLGWAGPAVRFTDSNYLLFFNLCPTVLH